MITTAYHFFAWRLDFNVVSEKLGGGDQKNPHSLYLLLQSTQSTVWNKEHEMLFAVFYYIT